MGTREKWEIIRVEESTDEAYVHIREEGATDNYYEACPFPIEEKREWEKHIGKVIELEIEWGEFSTLIITNWHEVKKALGFPSKYIHVPTKKEKQELAEYLEEAQKLKLEHIPIDTECSLCGSKITEGWYFREGTEKEFEDLVKRLSEIKREGYNPTILTHKIEEAHKKVSYDEIFEEIVLCDSCAYGEFFDIPKYYMGKELTP